MYKIAVIRQAILKKILVGSLKTAAVQTSKQGIILKNVTGLRNEVSNRLSFLKSEKA